MNLENTVNEPISPKTRAIEHITQLRDSVANGGNEAIRLQDLLNALEEGSLLPPDAITQADEIVAHAPASSM
jgi:hypothetical protein